MCVVATTTTTAAVELLSAQVDTIRTQLNNHATLANPVMLNSFITASLIVAMLVSTGIIVGGAIGRMMGVGSGLRSQAAAATPA